MSEEVHASILRRVSAPQPSNGIALELPALPAVPDSHAAGASLLVPANGRERSHPIGAAPVTIGFSSDCDVVLPNGKTPGMERVRVWRRDGRFMLHNLSHGSAVRIAGKSVTWVVLEHGDEIEIGGSIVTFQESKEPDRNF
ncbi:MAG: hypothetical protein IH957_12225 [Chloroflexi bacterium]|nr:hypothetical protein [Chloroflexota bacterium]